MSILKTKLQNIVKTTPSSYPKFSNRYVAYTFKIPTGVTIFSINNILHDDITDHSSNIIANSNDSNRPVYNWEMLSDYNSGNINPFGTNFWTIPLTGNAKYLSRFTYNSDNYYTIFGKINSTGDIITDTALGSDIEIAFETTDPLITEIVLEQTKLEAFPTNASAALPCNTVVNYYNSGSGLFTIPGIFVDDPLSGSVVDMSLWDSSKTISSTLPNILKFSFPSTTLDLETVSDTIILEYLADGTNVTYSWRWLISDIKLLGLTNNETLCYSITQNVPPDYYATAIIYENDTNWQATNHSLKIIR